MRLPNFLIIGAHKCGTTSLHEYLSLHPETQMSRTKELHYFVDEVNWGKGQEWYESYFLSRSARARGESSPSYTNYPTYSGVPERAYSLVPTAKLIFCVRDPVARILSHFRMERARAPKPRPFETVVMSNLDNPYVNQSRYWFQIKQWLNYYGFARILVVAQEDLQRDRQLTLQRVFSFLEIDPLFEHPDFEVRHNLSDDRERKSFGAPQDPIELTEEHREQLVDALAPDIEQFRRYMALDFPDWTI